MKLDRNAAKKMASLSAVGLGVMGSAGEADAAAIVVDAGDAMVGFKSGAGLSFSHDFGGPRFLFDRVSNYMSGVFLRDVRALGYGGLGFLATASSDLRIVAAGVSASGSTLDRFGVARWFRNGASSGVNGHAPFSSQYALFRFILSGNTHYGWVELSLENDVADRGPTLTIHRFAWEGVADTSLAAGDTLGLVAAPEPSAFLMSGLGALGLGAAGIRRWRAAKVAA